MEILGGGSVTPGTRWMSERASSVDVDEGTAVPVGPAGDDWVAVNDGQQKYYYR